MKLARWSCEVSKSKDAYCICVGRNSSLQIQSAILDDMQGDSSFMKNLVKIQTRNTTHSRPIAGLTCFIFSLI
jgi:hypothetical protein